MGFVVGGLVAWVVVFGVVVLHEVNEAAQPWEWVGE